MVNYPSDGHRSWGDPNATGIFNGLYGDLQGSKVDMAYANLFVMDFFTGFTDYSHPYNTDYMTFVVAQPQPLAQWQAITYPLEPLAWAAFIGIMILCLMFIYFIKFFEVTDQLKNSGEIFLITYGVILDQSNPKMIYLRSQGIRFFIGIFALSTLIISLAYKGTLISVLTVPFVPKPMDLVSELAERALPIGTLGFSFESDFRGNPDPIIQGLADKNYPFYDVFNTFEKCKNGEVSIMTSESFSEYIIKKDFTDSYGKSSLHLMKEKYKGYNIAYAFPKNSPYNQRISQKIDQLKEAGITTKIIR